MTTRDPFEGNESGIGLVVGAWRAAEVSRTPGTVEVAEAAGVTVMAGTGELAVGAGTGEVVGVAGVEGANKVFRRLELPRWPGRREQG